MFLAYLVAYLFAIPSAYAASTNKGASGLLAPSPELVAICANLQSEGNGTARIEV